MRRTGRVLGWGALAAVLALGPQASAQDAEGGPGLIVIRGTIRDQSGAPLADYPVRLIKTKTTLRLLHFSTGSRQEEYGRTQTDPQGRFELKVARDPQFDYFYLRFYDPKTFDPVRYSVPADVDITKTLKTKPELEVDSVILNHPDWSKVESLLSEFGAQSNRGKILRSLGLPERRQTFADSPGKESWWYYAKGLCYQLQGDQVLKIRNFDPVLPPRPSA
ncbi:MAG: carboxypeptidase-like regulatory domain-containing protein [Acidobacteria bacterium]|nr:carboxypeptidase-like regulatory domain-containing protein [Acidobacteriota bacterium]MCI0567361.1 carboxypeptidase-like regulatory domain-containing protein [Acidobacteriota bacterium]